MQWEETDPEARTLGWERLRPAVGAAEEQPCGSVRPRFNFGSALAGFMTLGKLLNLP